MPRLNSTLLRLAKQQVWKQASHEKQGFQPPGGGDPAAAGGMPPGGAPPAGGDPAAAGGMPPGGMPMDPAAAGAAGMPPMGDPAAMGMMQAAPQPQGQGSGGKPKFDPLMLDYRMYNLQQQLSAIMNALNIEVPSQALIMPPGTMGAPPAEQAMPGGPMDPASMQGAGQGGQGGGGSAIGPIEPMQGASPELAAMGGGAGGGAPKMASALPTDVEEFRKEANENAPDGWHVVMVKTSTMESSDVDSESGPKKSAPPSKQLNVPGAPGTRPATQAVTAGGSKDPKSRTEAADEDGPANKAASFGIALAYADEYDGMNVGSPVSPDINGSPKTASPMEGAAALAAMFRSRNYHG